MATNPGYIVFNTLSGQSVHYRPFVRKFEEALYGRLVQEGKMIYIYKLGFFHISVIKSKSENHIPYILQYGDEEDPITPVHGYRIYWKSPSKHRDLKERKGLYHHKDTFDESLNMPGYPAKNWWNRLVEKVSKEEVRKYGKGPDFVRKTMQKYCVAFYNVLASCPERNVAFLGLRWERMEMFYGKSPYGL